MANEFMGTVTGSDAFALINSDPARLAEQLNANAMILLADRGWLWRNPNLVMLSDASGSGSLTLKTPLVGLDGFTPMAATLEYSDAVVQPVTLDSFAITVARQSLEMGITDLNELIDSVGLNAAAISQSMIGSAHHRFTDMVGAAGAGFTAVAGSDTAATSLVVDDVYDATYSLEQRSVPGPWLGLLHPITWTQFRESLRSEGGAISFQDATAELLNLKGPGFKGTFLGADWHASTSVTLDTGVYQGCLFGRGGIAYREGSVRSIPGVGAVQMATPIYITLDYAVGGALNRIVGNYNVGVGLGEDDRGVTIQTGVTV